MAEDAPIQLPARRCADVTDGQACSGAGIWMPVLLLYPSVLHGPSPPMLVEVDVALCDRHKNDATVKDFATERIYGLAERACANAGKPWPERTLTRLKWLPWAQTQLGKIKSKELAQAN